MSSSSINRKWILLQVALLIFLIIILIMPAPRVLGLTYGTGGYGNCQFNTCGITLSLASGGMNALSITPTSSGSCTIKKESATIVTGSDTGFSLMLQDGDADNSLKTVSGSSIASISGTVATPTALAVNTWGFRVDGVGGFGVGPTSEVTNVATPSSLFAAVPLSTGSAATIAKTAVSTGSTGVTVNTFFGSCIDTSKESGQYTDAVIFTAIVN
ncbi:hypothetical protein CYG49_03145 [Candidatus Saccharibacteria bacterium]|nr:MAG: hypothetical protein CYG49_03145 [Candidatus Saccharibacteria bacterium]